MRGTLMTTTMTGPMRRPSVSPMLRSGKRRESILPSELVQISVRTHNHDCRESSERMPEVVLQTNSLSVGSGIVAVALLPVEPKLRILKRPSNNSPTPQPESAPTPTIKEREAAYAAARERIFNSSSPTAAPASEATKLRGPRQTPPGPGSPPQQHTTRGSTSSSNAAASVRIVRDPMGPTGAGNGFKRKNRASYQASPTFDTAAVVGDD